MDPIAQSIADQYKTQMGGTPPAAPTAPVTPPIVPAVEPIVPPKEPVTPPATPPAEPIIPPVVPPVIVNEVKSFEDELKERSKGKYNKWEEVETELTPKELKFANDKIKRFNELAEKGVDVTSKEFLELQGLDVEKADSLFEKWKRSDEGKGLSDATIKHEINKKYNVEEWADKDEADLTLDDKANKEKMLRDINLSKDWLTNYKNERVLEKQVDPKVAEALAEDNRVQLNNWDKFVDTDLVNKITKLSVPISYKDETGKMVESSVDYNVSADDAKYVSDLMKQLPRDSNAFFNQFKDDKGNQNHEALIRMVLRDRGYDKAMAESYSKGAEQRALVIEKASKNTNFAATPTGGEPPVLSQKEAWEKSVREQVKAHG